MKNQKLLINISLPVICLFISSIGLAQAKWEVDMVRNINPRYPSNETWKSLSSTTRPIAIAVPFAMLAVSIIDNNKRLEQDAYEVLAGIAIATAVTEGLKRVVNRPRPFEKYSSIYPAEPERGYSSPSGHVSIAFATAASVSLVAKKWYIAVPAFMWAGGVGYARLYLGQHYPSDLIAGALTGIAGAYTAHWLNKKFFPRKNK